MRTRLAPRTGASRAFTLVELLVVVVIIAAATLAVAPAVTSVLASNNESGAVNRVSSALANARALAIRNQRVTGVAFRFDAVEERASIETIEFVRGDGFLADPELVPAPRNRRAAIFRPVPGVAPVELPPSTLVVGFSSGIAGSGELNDAYQRSTHEYSTPAVGLTTEWYAGEFDEGTLPNPAAGAGNADELLWLFPRDDARIYLSTDELGRISDESGETFWSLDSGGSVPEARRAAAARHAMTFAVLFGPGGEAVRTIATPSGSVETLYVELDDGPVDLGAGEREPFDASRAFDPEVAFLRRPGTVSTNVSPNDEYVCRVAQQIAVLELTALRRGVGVERPWLVRSTLDGVPAAVSTGWRFENNVDRATDISAWIDNNAVVLGINPVSGQVVRRSVP
jgi:prepilin-type N-terminal cleavage/methylation domain-containing protein